MFGLRGRVGWIGAPAVGAMAFAAAALATSTSAVANGGFEKPMVAGFRACGNGPGSVGNWQPYTQGPGPIPAEVPAPVHAGKLALDVQTVGTGNCTATAAYQDVPSVSSASSFVFTVWAFPQLGEQQQSIFFGWDHSAGTVAGDATMAVAPSGVSFDAFGQSGSGPAVSYGAWHKLVLSVDAVRRTATMSVDGTKLGTTAPGFALPVSTASVYLGQGSGLATADDHFDYDGVVLDATPHAKKLTPSTVARGSTSVQATLKGTNFSPDSTVSVLGGGVTVDSVTVTSATSTKIVLDVATDAPTGAHDLTVTSGSRTGTCTGCLTVS